MTEFTVIAYEKEDGESPVEDFINGLDVKMRAKMYGLLSILMILANLGQRSYNFRTTFPKYSDSVPELSGQRS